MSLNQAINIQTTTLNAIAPTGSLSIGDTQTTGALNMGTNAGRTGGINIATSSAICPINIMNGSTTGGSVNIANGTGASQTTAVNIGTGSTTGTVTIGNTANTVQINGALKLGNGRNITLSPTSGYVAPTSLTMLGGITSGTYLTPSSSFSSTKNIATITLEKGSYLLQFGFNANCTTAPSTDYYTSFDETSTAVPRPSNFIGASKLTAVVLGYYAMIPVSITTGGTIILKMNLSGGTINTITQSSYTAMRIA